MFSHLYLNLFDYRLFPFNFSVFEQLHYLCQILSSRFPIITVLLSTSLQLKTCSVLSSFPHNGHLPHIPLSSLSSLPTADTSIPTVLASSRSLPNQESLKLFSSWARKVFLIVLVLSEWITLWWCTTSSTFYKLISAELVVYPVHIIYPNMMLSLADLIFFSARFPVYFPSSLNLFS